MPYKCVHCSKLFDDGSKEVLSGCSGCGRKFFFYIKKEKLDALGASCMGGTGTGIAPKSKEEQIMEFAPHEKEKIEEDVREIAGIANEETPVFLDLESVRILKEGKYLLDLGKLFAGKPQVYQLEDGKYIVDFSALGKKEEEKD